MSELPSGWDWTTIGEATEVVLGQSPPGSSYNDAGAGLPFFQGKAEFGELHPTVVKWTTAPKKVAEVNDVLLSVRAPVGPTNLAPTTCSIGRGLAALRGTSAVDHRYLLWWMRASTDQLASRATGSTFTAVSGAQVRAHPIPLAPRAEQERIVAAIEEHLSRLDAAESVLTSAEERVAVLAQTGVRQLFESRPWPWKTLAEIAEIKGGVTKDSKRQSDPSFVEVPYLRVANVQRGRLDLSEVTTIRVHPDKAKALRLEPGDVLLNEGGDRDKLGRGWVWEGEVADCIHQNHVFRARLNDDFDPYFVSTHANTWGQAWFEEHGRQTTNLASINLGTLRQLPVPAPPRSEQEVIVAELQASSEAQRRLLASIDHAQSRARALRRSILAAAFSGHLVPQDPEDEPASVLLDRIRSERAAAAPTKRTRKVKTS
ncbi:MAG: restriction endonuclease subunit S [Acidimicrobiales bacterium]|nr:restriction endonuclease subunit S [Acidimicrobiales bacterium]